MQYGMPFYSDRVNYFVLFQGQILELRLYISSFSVTSSLDNLSLLWVAVTDSPVR